MKKGQIIEGTIVNVDFPNKGIMMTEEGRGVIVKNALPGQKVSVMIQKIRKGKAEGRLLEVLEKSPLELEEATCPHFGECGGCVFQSLPYEEQLKIKSEQVKKLLDAVIPESEAYVYEPIVPSPRQYEYRNKMEFTFGDEYKDGPLSLGMHKRGSFYDIVAVENCQIVDEDYRRILGVVREYFANEKVPFYHRLRHDGYLRHLLVRKAVKTGDILVDLVTASETALAQGEDAGMSEEQCLKREQELLEGMKDVLLQESYDGQIAGILHTRNDSVADTVTNQGTEILYGQDYFHEELLGLRFRISPFSFFQTNSLGAEKLYSTAREFILESYRNGEQDEMRGATIYDLYSGTGTIAQMMASVCGHVVGVEIVEEAVEAARENAKLNGLDNCDFIAGDVLKILDNIEDQPDYIILDPPRDGIHPKALQKILDYQVDNMVYISCKPTSLARDLVEIQARGYHVKRVRTVDMFPATGNVETVVLLSRRKADDYVEV